MAGGCRAVLLALGLGACGGDDTPAGGDRAGVGPANEQPLWVPAPGTIGSWSTSEERIVGSERWFLAGVNRATFDSAFGPSEPYFVRTYSKRPGGIYQIADTRFGRYDEPVLVVPDTVRVGMRWYGAPFGKRRFTFEVVERSERAKPGSIVWYIEVTDDDRVSRGAGLSPVYQGEAFTLVFVEGSPAGPFAGPADPTSTSVELPGTFVPAAMTPAVATYPERSLRELFGGATVTESVVPTFFGLVNDPARPDVLNLSFDGIGALFSGGAGVFNGLPGTGCGIVSRNDGATTGVEPKDCANARGSIIDGTGRLLRIIDDGWRRAREVESIVIVNGMQSYNYHAYRMGGIYRAADGSAHVFRIGDNGGVFIAPHPGGTDQQQAQDMLPGSMPFGTPLPLSFSMWLPEVDATGITFLSAENGLTAAHVASAGGVDA